MTPAHVLHPIRLPLPVLLYLAAMLLPIRFAVGPVQMTSLRLYLAVMIIPLLVALLRAPKSVGKRIDLTLLAFVLWVGLSMAQTTPTHAVENAGTILLELLGGYLLARRYIQNGDQFSALIKLLVVVVVATLPLAIFESMTGRAPMIELLQALPGLASVGIVDIAPRLGLERAQVLFAHPIHYGLFTSTVVALAFVGLQTRNGLPWRVFGASAGILGSFLALSSGAFLSVLLQLFLIGWLLAFGARRPAWVGLLSVAAIGYLLVDLASNRTPVRVFFSYATFSAHNAYWRGIIFEWGMVNVAQNPVFGLGLNDWVRPAFMRSGSMDNFWLVVAVRYGIPGFSLLAAAYLAGLFKVGAQPQTAADRPLKIAWLICFAGLTFTLCTVHIWTSVFSYVFFLFGAGLWMLHPASQVTAKPPPLRAPPRFTRFGPVAT